MNISEINISNNTNTKPKENEFILYYNNENAKQYCQIFKSLFDDYNIAENNKQKNMLYKNLFLNDVNSVYIFDYYNGQYVIKYNNNIYYPNKKVNTEKDINYVSIFFDYKQNKNIIIDNIFDILETNIYSYSEVNKNNDEEYISWIDLEGKELNFTFGNIGVNFINNLDMQLNFTIHITPLLEEYNFNISPKTIQKGDMFENHCVIYQNKI